MGYGVYVLVSLKNNKRYVGYTSKDPKVRLEEHNRGCGTWTRRNRPFELVYHEEYSSSREAKARERFLKGSQGRKFLDTIIPR